MLSCMVDGRRGPAFGTGVAGELEGERLVDRLAAAGRRSMLVDRQDMLTRHVTGALGCLRHSMRTLPPPRSGAEWPGRLNRLGCVREGNHGLSCGACNRQGLARVLLLLTPAASQRHVMHASTDGVAAAGRQCGRGAVRGRRGVRCEGCARGALARARALPLDSGAPPPPPPPFPLPPRRPVPIQTCLGLVCCRQALVLYTYHWIPCTEQV